MVDEASGEQRVQRVAEQQTESLGNRIDLTPSSSCGLNLSAESFGPMLAKTGSVKRPRNDVSAQPRTPDLLRGFDSSDDEPGCSPQPARESLGAIDENNYATTLPPRVQRNVEALMRDISLVHAAGELCEDPFVLTPQPNCRSGALA